MADRELLERLDTHIARGNVHMARGNELMEQIREEHRLNREEHRLNREEHRLNRAFIESTRQVLRELVLEVRENREALKDIRHGIQAQTDGLMHVLDELRRRDDPGGATA
jgi:hypothetical protein